LWYKLKGGLKEYADARMFVVENKIRVLAGSKARVDTVPNRPKSVVKKRQSCIKKGIILLAETFGCTNRQKRN